MNYNALLINKIIHSVDTSPESLNQLMIRLKNSKFTKDTDIFDVTELTEDVVQKSVDAHSIRAWTSLLEFLDFFRDPQADEIRRIRDRHRIEYVDRYREYLDIPAAEKTA